MNDALPVRKRLRLDNYDYSQNGAYFITVCIKDRHDLLGTITEYDAANANDRNSNVGDAVLCVPNPRGSQHILLSEIGICVKEYLEKMNTLNADIQLDNYVIMPNHIHLLVSIKNTKREHREPPSTTQENGTQRTAKDCGTQRTASPTSDSPSKAVIPQIVHGLKAFTTKRFGELIWQRSYYDHIVRNEEDYVKIWNYIDTNIQNWRWDRFFE